MPRSMNAVLCALLRVQTSIGQYETYRGRISSKHSNYQETLGTLKHQADLIRGSFALRTPVVVVPVTVRDVSVPTEVMFG